MAIDSNFYKKKKARNIYFALGFLVIVVLGTGGLFFYNKKLEDQNTRTIAQIEERQKSITDLKKDKNIETYHIYNLNQQILDDVGAKSDISGFVEHALRTMVRYDLTFQDFSYNSGEIKLNVSSESNDKGLAYSKVIKFLNEYNKNEASLFELQPVENFTGQDNIKFPVTFTIK